MLVMNKKRIFLYVFLIIALIVIIATWVKNTENSLKPEWTQKRTIRYSFVIENKTKEIVKNVVFKTYSPLIISSTQKLENLKSNYDFIKQKDEFGNQELTFKIALIPPYSKKQISITAELLLSNLAAGAAMDKELFLMPQALIESKNKRILRFVSAFKGTKKEKLEKIYNWEVENINYSGYGFRDKGALYALNNLEGDCTEFAYLMVAASRALNIPARAVNGYVVNHNSKLNPSEFHSWAEVWVDGGWQVIDAQKKEFMSNQQDFIAMNIITDESKKQLFKKFLISHSNLTITMK